MGVTANRVYVVFPGLDNIISAQMTFTHGVSPSVCVIQMTPQVGFIPELGTLRWIGSGTVISFPGSIIDAASLSVTSQGYIWQLRILDRRWRWRFGEVNGHYNRRLVDGSIDTAYEKTPQELAGLLLDAMGEQLFDVGAMPNFPRPEVNWRAANPANELGALADAVGCRVVLGLDNIVRVLKAGVGGTLPVPLSINQAYVINPIERPDRIKVVTAPVMFESKWRLEAVGEDTDGQILPIDELSYKPSGGWETEYPRGFYGVSDDKDNKRALKTVFRWYRIKDNVAGTGGTLKVPGFAQADGTQPDVARWQVLPLLGGLIETIEGTDGIKRAKKSEVQGVYFDGKVTGANTEVNTDVDVSWSIDSELGIVQFNDPVYKLDTDDENKSVPAELMLRVAYHVKIEETRQEVWHERFRPTPGVPLGTGDQIVFQEEIQRTIEANYDSSNNLTGLTDNVADVTTEAEYYLDAEIDKLVNTTNAFDIEYAGLLAINPDGAIRQVSWSTGLQGAFTRASRNDDFDTVIPTYEQHRKIEEAQEQRKRKRATARRGERESTKEYAMKANT